LQGISIKHVLNGPSPTMTTPQTNELPEQADLAPLAREADRAVLPVEAAAGSQLDRVVCALSAGDELAGCRDVDAMLRLAIELARDRLGLEQVRLYVRDHSAERRDHGAERIVMRGTWGSGEDGAIIDERAAFHELTRAEYDALFASRLCGGIALPRAQSPWFAPHPSPVSSDPDPAWVMATPLVCTGEVVGVMARHCALGRTPLEDAKQAAAAIFCTLLANVYGSRRNTLAWHPLPRKSGQSPLVERILAAMNEGTPITGERLARELGVSPGHLARSFKREMGISLVDYRNRLRIDRFFAAIQSAGSTVNLLEAALQAGFGSYAQFHRVYRKFLGTTPRDIFHPTQRAIAPALDPLGAEAPPGRRPGSRGRQHSASAAAFDAESRVSAGSLAVGVGFAEHALDHSKRGNSTLVA
jgi:AraC-like DNA-binding protein